MSEKINRINLDDNIQNCINGLTENSTYEEMFTLGRIINDKENFSTFVNCGCDLPDASTGCVSDGQAVYVKTIEIPVYKANKGWYGFDGRLYRYDGDCRLLLTWGDNSFGQLGDGTVICRSSPVNILTTNEEPSWCAVASGLYHSLAIKTDGTLWTWGYNLYGQLGDGTTTSRLSPGTTLLGGTDWCDIRAGGFHSLAIKTDGTLWTWGYNSCGQLGDGTTTSRRSPGTTAAGGTDWCAVASGARHSLALKTDGTLWTWGLNNCGQLGDGTNIHRSSPGTTAAGGTDWCQIASGSDHSLALKTDGTLWTWGCNGQAQLGDGTTTSRRSPGTTAAGGTNWCTVAAGDYHSLAIKTDGTLWTWGANAGQLGDGTTIPRGSPVTTAAGGTDWCTIDGGGSHSLAIKTDGTLWTWGQNDQAQLGDGTLIDRSSPGTTIYGGTNWCVVSGGCIHSLAIEYKPKL